MCSIHAYSFIQDKNELKSEILRQKRDFSTFTLCFIKQIQTQNSYKNTLTKKITTIVEGFKNFIKCYNFWCF